VIEFGILSVAWIVLMVFISRKGTAHLVAPHVGVTLPVAGGVLGALVEALPTTPMSPGFTIRTVIAVVAGVFAGRLFGKVVKLWAMGQEKRIAANPGAPPPRLAHPLIAAGIVIAGIPALWHLITSSHEFLEEHLTPRDAKTGIVHGCEEIRLEGKAPDGRAVLLLHGLYGSPADFAELPAKLHAKGLAVYAPLLPGHGRLPDDLDAVWSADWTKAARAAFDDLAAKHPSVAIVGVSMGGTLALVAASERKPSALVLANPYLGHLVTPSWCPVSFESLVGPMSRMVRRVIAEQDPRVPRYSTQSLHALRQCRDLAAGADAAAKTVACPALVLIGTADVIVPPDFTIDWTMSHLPAASVSMFNESGHDLFHDADADAAADAVVEFLTK
jgi:carboxylesterase